MWHPWKPPTSRPNQPNPAPAEPYVVLQDSTASWKDLERYSEPRPGQSFIDELNFRYTKLCAKLVSPDVAVVMSDFEWDLKLKGGEYAKPLSGRDPVMTVRPSFVSTLREAGKVKAPAAVDGTPADFWA